MVVVPWPTHVRFGPRTVVAWIKTFLFSQNSVIALLLFTASAFAVVVHKITLIRLHAPLPILHLMISAPFLFAFDLLTLTLLHRAFASTKRGWQILAGFISIVIISCSASFVSLYLETNAELKWHRTVEIVYNWEAYRGYMAQGRGSFDTFFVIYVSMGTLVVLPRLFLSRVEPIKPQCTNFRLTLFLLCGTLLITQQPWKRLKSTLLYDFVSSVTTAVITRNLKDTKDCSTTFGANPLGTLNYSPAKDPYYISNLDAPIHEFINDALEGAEFTNIVHIVLESMRADCFPFQEGSQLTTFIENNFDLPDGGAAITTANVTPFIASLSKNTIQWDRVFATVPFTHKAMIGHYCGQLGLPLDFTVEFEPPAKMYQHCLPQVFRHINSITKTEDEILAIARGTRPEITDMWETVHIEAASGAYDHEKDILEAVGFGTVLTGEEVESIRYDFGGELWGFDDETALEFLWKYVDNTISREPRNRMYLGWMSTTTHTPFKVLPDWLTQNYQAFVNDHREWQSTDAYLNAVRWTDDKVKEIILGFRERGIENETLFLIHGDHGYPFAGEWGSTAFNPHNEPYQIPLMIYNPNIRNMDEKRVEGDFYTLSLPTTILDLMIHTKSLAQEAQQTLARRFAENYEFAQSLLRPVKEALRIFLVHPGGTEWVLDNSRNLRCSFNLHNDYVSLVDYVVDPLEADSLQSWDGVEGLILEGAEQKFGVGTEDFLRAAYEKQKYMKTEILTRYGLQDRANETDVL